MKPIYNFLNGKLFYFLFVAVLLSVPVRAQVLSYTFSYTGGMQSFTVPTCVSLITFDIRGGAGANALDKLTSNSTGGLGGRVQGAITVTPGQVINLFVGGSGNTNGSGGYNGGGAGGNSIAGSGACTGGFAGGGGGASDVRVGGLTLADRVAVAGGGGGAGRDYCNGSCLPCGCGGSGGAGGGLTGVVGQAAMNCGFLYPGTGVNGGFPGTPTAAGAGGPGDAGGTPGLAGAFGIGGGGSTGGNYDVAGGGGGGGYYGGGGGGGASTGSGVGAGGGGGGSSFIGTMMSASTTQSFQTGDGMIIISFNFGLPSLVITGSNGYMCAGASATLNVTGASSYTWNTGSNATSIVISPTANATYSVIGTGTAACPPYAMLQVTAVPLPIITVSSSAQFTQCPGTDVTLFSSGGDFYNWAGGTGGITEGVPFPAPAVTTTYTVTGTSTLTACSNTASIVVPIYATPVTVSSSTTICSGESYNLSANNGIQYAWSNGSQFFNTTVSPTVTTVYTVTITTAEFCVVTRQVTVTVNPSPNVTAVCTRTAICQNEATTITANGATTYLWNNNAGTSAAITVSPSIGTVYIVTGTTSGCSKSATITIKVSVCSGIEELGGTMNELISVYPNPNNGNFTIKTKGAMELELINELGQLIKTISLHEKNNFSTVLNGLPAGIYFIKGKEASSKINQKIVVN